MNPVRKLLIPFLYRQRGSKQLYYYDTIKKCQWNSLEENIRLQKKQLYDMVTYSLTEIPYYRDLGIRMNSFSEDSIFQDLRKLPFLTKEILRKEFDRLAHPAPDVKRVYTNSTGGSTGEPALFLQDDYYHDWSMASKILLDDWAGRSIGEPQISLWGSFSEILEQREALRHRLADWVRNVRILNVFRMNREDMQKYVDIINQYKPVLILAYVHSIYELAGFVESNGMHIHTPRSVMTSAGVLYEHQRETIERIFQCPVYNRYGSREVGDMACECEQHNGLHRNIFSHYIEVVDDEGEPCKPGERGHIVVTTLRNRTMPLLRYKIGDMAVASDRKCACGRGLPLIESVVGRSNSMIRTKKGVFDNVVVCALFTMDYKGNNYCSFSKYQVIQKKEDEFVIKIVVDKPEIWPQEKLQIIYSLHKVLGNDIKLCFEEVDRIEPLSSGKYAYIVSELES